MGIIQRQGLNSSLVNYLGAGIGILSTLFVYELAIEAYGLVQLLKATALLFLPLANWGIQSLTTRFFPIFKTIDGKHHGFLSFLLIISSIAFLVFAFFAFIFWDDIYHYYSQQQNQENPADFSAVDYLWYFVPLTYLLILINLLIAYIANFQRIVLPAILHEFFLKILLPTLILLFAFHYIDLEWLVRFLLLGYALIVVALLIYLRKLNGLQLYRPAPALWKYGKSMADFAGFSMLGSLGGMLAFQLDTVMMGGLDTLTNTGVYSLAINMTMMITIPQRSLINITGPIIADRWQQQDTAKIGQLYQQTSLLLLIVGLFLMLEITFNFEDLSRLVSNEDLLNAYLPLLILGVGRLFDMATSINGEIIQYSTKYRYNIYFILILGGVNIVLNIMLIPRYGMVGAATATAFSLMAFNLIRLLFIYYTFGMLPVSRGTWQLLLVAATTFGLAWLMPDTGSLLFNFLYRCTLIALLFLGLTYWWKISPEFNTAIDSNLAKLKIWPRKRS